MNFKKCVCALMSIFILAGCKSKPIVESKPKDELEGNITIWATKENSGLLTLSANNFNKLHSNSRINIIEAGANELFDKLQVSLISNENFPDIICFEDEEIQKLLKVNANMFEETSDLVKKDNYLKYKVDNLSYEGKLYGYPVTISPIVMLYRSDLYQTAGINTEYIKTWDDYIEAGKKVASKSEKPAALLPIEDERLYRIFLNQLAGSYVDKKGKPDINSPKALKALEMERKVYASGIAKGTKNFEEAVRLFIKGEGAGLLVSTDQVNKIYKEAPELKEKLQVKKLPAFEEGGNQAVAIGGSNLIILKSSKNKKLSTEFAKFASENKDNLVSMMNGTGVLPAYTYYNDEKGFGDRKILELSREIYGINYTGNYINIKDYVIKAVLSVIKDEKEPSAVMNELQKNLSIPND